MAALICGPRRTWSRQLTSLRGAFYLLLAFAVTAQCNKPAERPVDPTPSIPSQEPGARRWNPSEEIRINRWFRQQQSSPSAAVLADGKIGVAWETCPGLYDEPACTGQDGDSCGVAARIFDGTTGHGKEFLISLAGEGSQRGVSVAGTSAGGMRAVWIVERLTGERGERIVSRSFSQDGAPLGPESGVAVPPGWHAGRPRLLQQGNGYLVAWSELGMGEARVRLSRLSGTHDNMMEPSVVASCTACGLRTVRLFPEGDGAWVLWVEKEIRLRGKAAIGLLRLNGRGEPEGGPIIVSDGIPMSFRTIDAVLLRPETLLVAWAQVADGPVETHLAYCLLDIKAGKCGVRNSVARLPGALAVHVALAAGNGGEAMVAWWSPGRGVWQRFYGPGMMDQGLPVRVNEESQARGGPRLSPLDVLVAAGDSSWIFWEGTGTDGSPGSIYGRGTGKAGSQPGERSGPETRDGGMPPDTQGARCTSGPADDESMALDVPGANAWLPQRAGRDWVWPHEHPTHSLLDGGPSGLVVVHQERGSEAHPGPLTGTIQRAGSHVWSQFLTAHGESASHGSLEILAACKDGIAVVLRSTLHVGAAGCLAMDIYSYEGVRTSTAVLAGPCPGGAGAVRAACLSDGAVALVWSAAAKARNSQDVHGLIADLRGTSAPVPLFFDLTVDGSMSKPAVSAFRDGRFVVVWKSTTGGTASGRIEAQLFERDGTPFGPPFRVDQEQGEPSRPSVAAGTEGFFLIVWELTGGPAGRTETRGSLRRKHGSPYLSDFPISRGMQGQERLPVARALPDSSYVVAWESDTGQTPGAVRFVHLLANGATVGGEGVSPQYETTAVRFPQVAPGPDGFFLGWSFVSGFPGGENSFRGRLLQVDSNDVRGVTAHPPAGQSSQTLPPLSMDESTSNYDGQTIRKSGKGLPGPPALAVSGAGEAMVVWPVKRAGKSIVEGAVVSDDGVAGPVLRLSGMSEVVSGQPVLAAYPPEAFTSCWFQEQAADGAEVVCTAVTGPDWISGNAIPLSGQLAGEYGGLTLAGCRSFAAAAWHHGGSDMSGTGIVLQRMARDGSAAGEAVIANEYVGGNQENPSLSALDDTTLLLVWEGQRQDESGMLDIYVRMLGAEGFLTDEEVRVNTRDRRHGEPPRVVGLQEGRYCVAWGATADPAGGSRRTVFHARCSDKSGELIGSQFEVTEIGTAGSGSMRMTPVGRGQFLLTFTTPGMLPEYQVWGELSGPMGAAGKALGGSPLADVHGPSGYAVGAGGDSLLVVGAGRSLKAARIPLEHLFHK